MPGMFYGTSQSYFQQPPHRVIPADRLVGGATSLGAASTLQANAVFSLNAAAVLMAAPVPIVSTLPTSGPFSVPDWGRRLVALLPQPWFPSSSLVAGSVPVAANEIPVGSIMQGLGAGFAQMLSALTYTQMQTRFATMTDVNLDQASIDLFGGVLPRIAGESDLFFSTRIRQLVVAQQPTIPGMQAVLSAYLKSLLLSTRQLSSLGADTVGALDTIGALDTVLPSGISPPLQAFGMDTSGGFDTYGFLDEQTNQSLATPYVYVFDQQSDPITASFAGIKPPQFGVALLFPGVAINLLHTDPSPFVPSTTLAPIANPFSLDVAGSLDNYGAPDESIPMGTTVTSGASVYFNQQFVNLVYWCKAEGTTPVFCTNGTNI